MARWATRYLSPSGSSSSDELFGGLDDVVDTPRGLLALIVAPFLVVLGFWKLSGAEDDDD